MFLRCLLAILLWNAIPASSQTLFPDTGRVALRQHALELRHNLRVLSISLRPGYEDLPTLASLRLSRGGAILCVYVTNGESGDTDDRDLFPHDLAVLRREEAFRAVGRLGGRAVFWNMPDRTGGGNEMTDAGAWDLDSLRSRMERTILQFKPDIILVHRDPGSSGGATPIDLVIATVVDVRRSLATHGGVPPRAEDKIWDVSTVWAEQSGDGVKADVDAVHPILKRTYREIAADAAREYSSLSVQRTLWESVAPGGAYRLLHPAKGVLKTLYQGLPVFVTGSLGSLQTAMQSHAGKILDGKTSRAAILRNTARLIDSVDFALRNADGMAPRTFRRLLDWKQPLEDLRVALLGVSVRWSQVDSVVTERQLFVVRIDTVIGVKDTARPEIYFPVLQQGGWILNEQASARLPLTVPAEFRLVTPPQVDYDLPAARMYLDRAAVGHEIFAFIIHRGERREESFFYRLPIRLRYAPRFMAEVQTPFVRCMPGEEVVVRLTNNTRDGVADTLAVRDSLVHSSSVRFRLPGKGTTQLARLPLTCGKSFGEGSVVAPIAIATEQVARTVVRAFDVKGNREKRAGLLTGRTDTQTKEAVRRAGWRTVHQLDSAEVSANGLDSLDVLIIDRRALSLVRWIDGMRGQLEHFVVRGGHMLILAQDAPVWNRNPLWPGIELTSSVALPESTPLLADSTHPFLAGPNRVSANDFADWAFRVGYNTVAVRAPDPKPDTVIRTAQGSPLVLTGNRGKGRMTYVGLAIAPPWMSVSPWSIRFLANLLSQ